MERILNYSYRGLLKSCNYNCSYCPFSRHASSPATIQADREALFRFCNYIETLDATPHSLQIFLLPYGEGMIHPHYTEALAQLSRLPATRRISCQTNLSWDISRFAGIVKTSGGDLARISFWCSFHPQCTGLTDFISQCNQLEQYGIRYCAGMVAKPGSETLAVEMRKALPSHTYMWLNSMDGLQRPYTPEETARFGTLDPFFALNVQGLTPDESDCRGGKVSLHVQADGRTALCPVAGKYTGNIYKNPPAREGKLCKAFRCNCYLAYSNRPASGLETFFGPGTFLRIPERTDLKKIFLDIDGTLTDSVGQLLPGIENTLHLLGKSAKLYFATELPYLYARRKYSSLFPLFSGGIFAGGAHIRLFNPILDYYFYISPELIRQIDSLLATYSIPGPAIKKYTTFQGIYRIAITGKQPAELLHQLSAIDGLNLQAENRLITIISKKTDKGKALSRLLQPIDSSDTRDSTLAIGNGLSDIAMFRQVKYALAVPGSPAEVQQAALGTMPVSLLPVFFGR